jgi:hypothetical protein
LDKIKINKFMTFKDFYNDININLIENVKVSENLKYHLDNNIPIHQSVFRIYSESWFTLLKESKDLYEQNLLALNDDDAELVSTDIGEKGVFDGEEVFLDAPICLDDLVLEEKSKGRKHRLNSPFRTPGGPKKFAVYVKGNGGRVKKVTFGDPNMRVRNNNKARAKSFRARHKCNQKKDRTTAGYWSCNISRYRKALGLKSSRVW